MSDDRLAESHPQPHPKPAHGTRDQEEEASRLLSHRYGNGDGQQNTHTGERFVHDDHDNDHDNVNRSY